MDLKELDVDILAALLTKGMRPCEIQKALWPKYNRPIGPFRPYRETRTLESKICQRLPELKKAKFVKGPRNKAWSLTMKGGERLGRAFLNDWIYSLPPTEVQVLQLLVHFFVSHVYILAPQGTTLEGYIRLFRERINMEDIESLAKSLMEDPKKAYQEFSEHLTKYKAEETAQEFAKDYATLRSSKRRRSREV